MWCPGAQCAPISTKRDSVRTLIQCTERTSGATCVARRVGGHAAGLAVLDEHGEGEITLVVGEPGVVLKRPISLVPRRRCVGAVAHALRFAAAGLRRPTTARLRGLGTVSPHTCPPRSGPTLRGTVRRCTRVGGVGVAPATLGKFPIILALLLTMMVKSPGVYSTKCLTHCRLKSRLAPKTSEDC
jgi:hypothetical protein